MPRPSSVTEAGRLTTTQCQKPLPVGASGSKQVTTKPRVSAGKPDQASCGERFLPPTLVWAYSSSSGWPSVTSVLVTVKDGTLGRMSYGSGAKARSRLMLGVLPISAGPRTGTGKPDFPGQPSVIE